MPFVELKIIYMHICVKFTYETTNVDFLFSKENSMNEQSYIEQIGLINFYFRYRKKISLPNSYGMCSLCIFCIQSINLFGKMNLIGNLYEKK